MSSFFKFASFKSPPLIFSFFYLQQQTPEFLNLLKFKTTVHNVMDYCTRSLGDILPASCLLTQCHSPVNILLKA